VVNGSIIYFSECEAHYIVESVRLLLEQGKGAMTVRPDVHAEFARSVDEANARMAWGASKVSSWYKSASGRVAQNWPFPLLEYWQRTREPDPDDYVLQ
jgi:4-hydroxyacetophenone monooxygenase